MNDLEDAKRAYRTYQCWGGVGDQIRFVMEEGAHADQVILGMKQLLLADYDCYDEETGEQITDSALLGWSIDVYKESLYIAHPDAEVEEREVG